MSRLLLTTLIIEDDSDLDDHWIKTKYDKKLLLCLSLHLYLTTRGCTLSYYGGALGPKMGLRLILFVILLIKFELKLTGKDNADPTQ
jgi:hypothetical protein